MERVPFDVIARKISQIEAARGEPIDLDWLLGEARQGSYQSGAVPQPSAPHTVP